MPQNNDRKNNDYSRYDALSTEELSEMLRLDSEAPEGNGLDIDTLLYITGVLAERNQSTNTEKTSQEAWNSFQQDYMESGDGHAADEKPAKNHKPVICRILAAAAVLVLIISIPLTARALNWGDIYGVVIQWAKETFSFVTWDTDAPSAKTTRQYASLQEALEQMEQQTVLIPSWIPEGYALQKIDLDETPFQRSYVAMYTNGEKVLTIGVYSYLETDPRRVEATADVLETYTRDNRTYYIVSNKDRIKGVWIQGSCECYIVGDLTIDEMKRMIDSIPKG